MKAEEFKKLAVVSIDSGAKLGYVDDLLFDTSQMQVAAFKVKAEGQDFLVPWGEIKSIGKDAVTVPSDAAARTTSAESMLASLPGLDKMHKLKVVDEKGDFIGKVSSLDIDPEAGTLLNVEAHEGGVLGIGGTTTPIAAGDVRSIGDEVMIVTAATLTKQTADEKTG